MKEFINNNNIISSNYNNNLSFNNQIINNNASNNQGYQINNFNTLMNIPDESPPKMHTDNQSAVSKNLIEPDN